MFVGAVQAILSCALPGVATKFVGGAGAVAAGVTGLPLKIAAVALEPTELIAFSCILYPVPFTRAGKGVREVVVIVADVPALTGANGLKVVPPSVE